MTILRKAAGAAAVTALAFAFERSIAAPHYHGPRTDHFDGEEFHNLGPTAREQGSFLKWMISRERGRWRDWVDAAPGSPPPERVDEGRIRVTFVNHATMLVQMDGLNILTDPMWSERCSPFSMVGPKRHRPPGIHFEDLPPIDAVLVSHNHYDHLDVPTLQRLHSRFAPRVVTLLGNSRLMARGGVEGATELDWWGSTQLSPRVSVTAVPSQHFCARALSDRNRNLWGGFVISGPSGRAYFAGDTGWGTHFEEIRARIGDIRVAMLPIGAYLPRWFMKPVHIEPAEAVAAHRALGAKTTIPMHYGTFALGDDGELQPLEDLRNALAAKGESSFRILEFGEGVDVD